MKIFVVILTLIFSTTAASATVILANNYGGKMEDYIALYSQISRSEEPVVIAGECSSACTMILGFVDPIHICATKNAKLGFHYAWQRDNNGNYMYSKEGTNILMQIYPEAIKNWIRKHGGLSSTMKYLQGNELTAIVAPCK